MTRYVLRANARKDLANIWSYGCEQFGEIQADSYLSGLLEHLGLLAQSPLTFPLYADAGPDIRRSVFKSHSVYFLIAARERVEIVRILRAQDTNTAF